jgi:UDP-GlcNAc3NAcA epimerase
MYKIVTVVGARPQIIKAAALSRAFQHYPQIRELIVHTGQHYDFNMSAIFFEQLHIPLPDYQFEIEGGGQGSQTAQMIINLENVLQIEKPDLLIVYGDTNSTVAGALAASKLNIPLAHIEAGMRSFNKSMPEEVNRIMTDHCSTLLFSPTKTGVENLKREGFELLNQTHHISVDHPKVYHCGDIMLDNSLYFSTLAKEKSLILEDLMLTKNQFILATIHRNTTTDVPQRMDALLDGLLFLANEKDETIVFPIHPRTWKQLEKNDLKLLELQNCENIKLIEPLSFLDMIQLEQNAKLILTDSGGVQKEAFYFHKPCLIARPETEWEELVSLGAAKLCDVDKERLAEAYQAFIQNPPSQFPAIFGDGHAAEFIAAELLNFLDSAHQKETK